MNSNFILLNSPITKQKTIIYTKINIQVLNHILGNNECDIQVEVFDDSCEYKKTYYYLLSGTDYLNWTTDNFLINWVQNKLRNEAL